MIRRLRRRMTLMVIAVLILVSAGIVLAIHLSNERSIAAQAEETLDVLTGSGSVSARETVSPKPDGKEGGFRKNGGRGNRGQPPDVRSGKDAATAGLSSSYTITLNEDGSVDALVQLILSNGASASAI